MKKFRSIAAVTTATLFILAMLVSTTGAVPAPPSEPCDGVWTYVGGPGTNMGWICVSQWPEWEAALDYGLEPVFEDTSGHWAEGVIDRMAFAGIIRGVSATRFEPQRNITRAEAAALQDRVVRMVMGNALQVNLLKARIVVLEEAVEAAAHLNLQTRARFTFTNSTRDDANDLHIKWRDGTYLIDELPEPFGVHTGSGGSRHDFSRGTVAVGESVSFWFGSTGNRLAIDEWYWTKDGVRVGPVQTGHPDNVQ